MPKFVLIYRNASPPSTPEEGQHHMAAWQEWSASLGSAQIDPGMPFGQTVAISKAGENVDIGPNVLNGVSVIEAEDCHAARAMAASCPHLNLGGDIVIAEGIELPM